MMSLTLTWTRFAFAGVRQRDDGVAGGRSQARPRDVRAERVHQPVRQPDPAEPPAGRPDAKAHRPGRRGGHAGARGAGCAPGPR